MTVLTRRDFVTAAAASGVALAAPNLAQAAAPAAMSLGFSLYGMKSLKTEAAMSTLAKIGYDAIELCLLPGFDADPMKRSTKRQKGLGLRAAFLGMTIPALMENLPLTGKRRDLKPSLERLKRAAALAHTVVPKSPPLIETVLGGGNWATERDRLIDRLGEWAKLAEREKITIAIKPHRGGAMSRPEQAVELLDKLKSRRIVAAYDYSHFKYRDIPLAKSITTLMPRTRFIHVKETVLVDNKPRFALPGGLAVKKGGTDFAKLLSLAGKAGYSGCVCVEVSSQLWRAPKYDPLTAAKSSYQAMSAAFRAAGIKRPR